MTSPNMCLQRDAARRRAPEAGRYKLSMSSIINNFATAFFLVAAICSCTTSNNVTPDNKELIGHWKIADETTAIAAIQLNIKHRWRSYDEVMVYLAKDINDPHLYERISSIRSDIYGDRWDGKSSGGYFELLISDSSPTGLFFEANGSDIEKTTFFIPLYDSGKLVLPGIKVKYKWLGL